MTQIFAFGHSITQGLWDREGGYIQRLRRFLDRKTLDNPEEYYFEVFNLGISGNDSQQILERIKSEYESRNFSEDKSIILLQAGANDTQYLREEGKVRVPEEEFEDNFRKLIKTTKGLSDKVIVIGEAYTTIDGPIEWSKDKELSDNRLERYVKIQRKVCKQRNVELIDLREKFSKEEWSSMLEDGVHPDSEGHKEIYKVLKKKLKEKDLLE